MKKIGIFASIIVLCDQLIKTLVTRNIELGTSITVIPQFFSLTYVKNIGAAWSILEGKTLFFILGSFGMMFILYYLFIRNKKLTQLEEISYGLLYGGILGNLLDRMIHGAVIDYLDFTIIQYNFPIFNLADIAIVCGCFLLIIILWKEDKKCKNIS